MVQKWEEETQPKFLYDNTINKILEQMPPVNVTEFQQIEPGLVSLDLS